ncbi:sugar phosphate nucleotidyltransferase [Streptomyces sp. NPDC058653]|uniref:sugar phosphate nucleotidyltransferase n=1 Tax=Streptomyces sp. NPDC058653 TaxID=3346576 RepID=UPI00364A526E
MPEQLIPIANKPVLEHVVEGIRDLGVRVSYIPQDEPRGPAHCVSIARTFLGDDDFVMYLGDNTLPDGVHDLAAEFRAARPAAQVVVHKVADPRAFGVAELDTDGTVLRLVEKPDEPRSDLALVGVYFFTPAVRRAVASIEPSARGELELTDSVQWLLTEGHRVDAREYRGYWKDTGRAEDVLDCNRYLLRDLEPGILGSVDAANDVGSQVRVEAGAKVGASRIEGPATVDIGDRTSTSHRLVVGDHTRIEVAA